VKQKHENWPNLDDKKELIFHQVVRELCDNILNCVKTALVVQGDTGSRKEKIMNMQSKLGWKL
jgi:transposase